MVGCFTTAVRLRCAAILGCVLFGALPANAQDVPDPAPVPLAEAGRVAESVAGEAGIRQTRSGAALRIQPMERVNSRIANRVQNRFRSRIDRYYDPQENVTSPFRTATERIRAAGGKP